MKRSARIKTVLALTAIGALALCFVYGPYWSSDVAYTDISPKGQYKVVTLRPSWFGFYHDLNKESPAFVRAYTSDGQLIKQSEIIDLAGNGRITWPTKEVPFIIVGVSILIPAQPE